MAHLRAFSEDFKMAELTKKCVLGFNEDRVLVGGKRNRKKFEFVINTEPVHFTKKGNRIICEDKPPLSKSDREDLGYHYKGGKLYNLNYAEVPPCIFCKYYE